MDKHINEHIMLHISTQKTLLSMHANRLKHLPLRCIIRWWFIGKKTRLDLWYL